MSAALVLSDITSDSLLYCVVRMQLSFFALSDSNDVICFYPSFAISMRVECSGAFERSVVSREFESTLEYASKFASRDLLSI